MHTVNLAPLLALKDTRRRKIFSNARSSTSIKDVDAVPADPITSFRPLFPFPRQQTMPALYQTASSAVLSRHRGEQNGNSSPSSSNTNHRSGRTLASPQKRVSPTRCKKNGHTRAFVTDEFLRSPARRHQPR